MFLSSKVPRHISWTIFAMTTVQALRLAGKRLSLLGHQKPTHCLHYGFKPNNMYPATNTTLKTTLMAVRWMNINSDDGSGMMNDSSMNNSNNMNNDVNSNINDMNNNNNNNMNNNPNDMTTQTPNTSTTDVNKKRY